MSNEHNTTGKVDSFYIETRVHSCNNIMCSQNMASVIPGERGHYCRYKKISIGEHGVCEDYQRAKRVAFGLEKDRGVQ